MPRDQVYQLRLTSEEKAKLASVAQGRDSSIAQMIRKDYGLDSDAAREIANLNPAPKVVREALEQPSPSTAVSAEMAEKRFKQLVAQLQGKGFSKEEAETAVRQRTGVSCR